MITEFCIRVYRYFAAHKGVYYTVLVALFAVFGYFATQLHLEEDLNKLMPSSKNEDGTTKLAFADLRIKDKTYLLFTGAEPDSLIATCDTFMDSLAARDTANTIIANTFYRLPVEQIPDVIEYLSAHLPSYIDTSVYAQLDTMLTVEHFRRQMQQNYEDMTSDFGEAYPELLEMDPIGLRNALLRTFMPIVDNSESSECSEDSEDSESSEDSDAAQSKKGGYIFIDDHIFTADSTICLAFLTPGYSFNNTGQGNTLFRHLNELIDKHNGSVRVLYHGTPASAFYNSTIIKGDLVYTIGGSMLLVLLFMLFCFRRWRVIPLMALPVVFGTLFAMTLMYFLKGVLSLLALGIGGVILGVAMSYALHIIVHQTYVGNPIQVLRDETKPVLLGCITTIGSFVGIMFVHTDLLRDFGLFASFAILGTTAFSLLLLPMLLPGEPKAMPKVVERISNYAADRSKAIVGVIGLLVVVFTTAFFIGGVHFDENMHNLGYDAKRVIESENLLDSKNYTGYKSKYFAASGKTMEEAIANYSALKAKLDSLQALGLVTSYSRTGEVFVPLTVQQERIDAWKAYWTPERDMLVHHLIDATAPEAGLDPAGFEAFFDLIHADFEPDALYDTGLIPEGYQSTLMEKSYGGDYLYFTSVRCLDQGSNSDSTDYNRICRAIANEPNMMVLDTYFYTRDTLKQLNSDFNTLQWLSLLFVLVVLFLSFHYNVRHSILGFMPIVLSWIIVLGAMYLFGKSFNLINIIISTFIFGVGVDYSIFVMNGLVNPEGNKLQHHRTAILLSAVILVLTVGSMLLARHPAIQSVGFSTLVGLIAAVVLAWVVQPLIYRMMKKK